MYKCVLFLFIRRFLLPAFKIIMNHVQLIICPFPTKSPDGFIFSLVFLCIIICSENSFVSVFALTLCESFYFIFYFCFMHGGSLDYIAKKSNIMGTFATYQNRREWYKMHVLDVPVWQWLSLLHISRSVPLEQVCVAFSRGTQQMMWCSSVLSGSESNVHQGSVLFSTLIHNTVRGGGG